VVVSGVNLRPVATSPGGVHFDILVRRECAGWLELTGTPEVMRLSGEVSERFRGRGVATAAVAAACRIAHSAMGTKVLEACVPNGLGAAHRVLEANGFSVANLREEPLRFELDLTTWSGSADR
jgi:ribosomal-protein-alanine N-acetyltransferase